MNIVILTLLSTLQCQLAATAQKHLMGEMDDTQTMVNIAEIAEALDGAIAAAGTTVKSE